VEKERQPQQHKQQQQQQQQQQHEELRGLSVASMISDCSNTRTVDRNLVRGNALVFLRL
jgi:hypothetical protein